MYGKALSRVGSVARSLGESRDHRLDRRFPKCLRHASTMFSSTVLHLELTLLQAFGIKSGHELATLDIEQTVSKLRRSKTSLGLVCKNEE